MAVDDFAWIYLLFFLIPAARLIPRILRRRKMQNYTQSESFTENRFEPQSETIQEQQPPEPSKPQTKDMVVLGELNRGTKTFENIKKNTGFESEELDSILEDLEKRGLARVEQKSGLFGTKIELFATEKGFKEYYS